MGIGILFILSAKRARLAPLQKHRAIYPVHLPFKYFNID